MTATLSPALADSTTARFAARRRMAMAIPAVILAYLIYAAISFDVAGLAQRARFDNASCCPTSGRTRPTSPATTAPAI